MRILFDQGTPVAIAAWLREHTVKTTFELGWDTLVNGDLLKAAEDGGFDLLLTTDNGLAYQQNLRDRKLGNRDSQWEQVAFGAAGSSEDR